VWQQVLTLWGLQVWLLQQQVLTLWGLQVWLV
jgi:hypothetical protein